MPSDTAPAMSASNGSNAALTLAAITAYRSNMSLEPGTLTILMAERDRVHRRPIPGH